MVSSLTLIRHNLLAIWVLKLELLEISHNSFTTQPTRYMGIETITGVLICLENKTQPTRYMGIET